MDEIFVDTEGNGQLMRDSIVKEIPQITVSEIMFVDRLQNVSETAHSNT